MMKKLLIILAIVLISCDNASNGSAGGGGWATPSFRIDDPVDPAFWFGSIYDTLPSSPPDTRQGVCTAINALWGTTLVPDIPTEDADSAYLLTMIDQANGNTTNYRTSSYVTNNRKINATDVAAALDTLRLPGTPGSRKFVAIRYDSNVVVYYDDDSATWAVVTLPGGIVYWRSLAYSGSRFVAIAAGGETVYSDDGITWDAGGALPVSPPPSTWNTIAYGNGKFIAFSDTGAASSTNGVTWTSSSPSFAGKAVAYGAGIGSGTFVAVNNTKAAYSADGTTWTEAALPVIASWNAIAYGNGKFVAVAANSNRVVYSYLAADGITINWAAGTLPVSAWWNAIAYGNGKFVALNNTGAAYSTDGINWTAAVLPGLPDNAIWSTIAYGNGKFVAAAANSDRAAYSTNGISWIPLPTMPVSGYWTGVAYK